jgi:hypothetical protein
MNVCFWHKAGILTAPLNVRFRGQSGHHDDSVKCQLLTISKDMPAYLLAFSNVIISLRVTVTHLTVTGGPPPAMCQAA